MLKVYEINVFIHWHLFPLKLFHLFKHWQLWKATEEQPSMDIIQVGEGLTWVLL